jgi:hypothetical protein
MQNEIDITKENEITTKSILKPGLKKRPANVTSVDDMEFDDPEYLQLQVRDEIANKHKKLRQENEKLEMEEKNNLESQENNEKEIKEDEEDNNSDKDEDSNEDEDDEDELSIKSDDHKTEFGDEKWISKFESICTKLNKKLIDLKTFVKSIQSLMAYLDPSKDENNKKRLCLLTQHLVEYYQSLFNLKSTSSAIDFKIVNECTNFIYELVSKYGAKSTKQEPSIFIELFKKILREINENYVALAWNERQFPQLNTVKNSFSNFKIYLYIKKALRYSFSHLNLYQICFPHRIFDIK